MVQVGPTIPHLQLGFTIQRIRTLTGWSKAHFGNTSSRSLHTPGKSLSTHGSYCCRPLQSSHPAAPRVAPFAPCRRRRCRCHRRPRHRRRPPGPAGRATTESPAGRGPRDGEPSAIASPASPAKLGFSLEELILYRYVNHC